MSQVSGQPAALTPGTPPGGPRGAGEPVIVSLRGVRKAYQIDASQRHLALADITFDVGRGEFV